MKNCKKFMLFVLPAAFLLSGCATRDIPLAPGAESVKVVDATTQPIVLPPLVCQLKGQILGSDLTPYREKNLNFTENEIHLIQNKALQLNANLAVIHKNAIVTDGNNYNHVSVSDAYECYPPSPQQNEMACAH